MVHIKKKISEQFMVSSHDTQYKGDITPVDVSSHGTHYKGDITPVRVASHGTYYNGDIRAVHGFFSWYTLQG
jgi:hypothetical protein